MIREPLTLGDGTFLSVQASGTHYCSPRTNDARAYTAVEVGARKPVPEFAEWADPINDRPDTHIYVYAWVPANKVLNYIEKHGGVRKGEMPPMQAVVIVSKD